LTSEVELSQSALLQALLNKARTVLGNPGLNQRSE